MSLLFLENHQPKLILTLKTHFGVANFAPLHIDTRRDKKAFLSDQRKEIKENNRMGKTRGLFKKIRNTKGTFHAKIGTIKDRNGMDLTEAEDTKKRWQEYTESESESEVAQSCPTLCVPMDCSPPGSSVHGIFQARILEWVAISSSRGSSQVRDQTCISCVSCVGRQILYHCASWEAHSNNITCLKILL